MNLIKKFIIEILLLAVFAGTCYLGYLYKRKPTIQPTINNAIQSEIDSIKGDNRRIDTLRIRQETKLQTIENNHYHEKINIILLSNDSQFNLLRSNITRYSYLLDTTRR